FTFVPPTVTSINTTSGGTGGGVAVGINGIGFTDYTAGKFGTIETSSVPFYNDPSLVAYTPTGESPGTVNVTVTTPGGTSATSAADQFTFATPPVPTVPPVVTSVTPSTVSAGTE